jgi:hypothetical protein
MKEGRKEEIEEGVTEGGEGCEGRKEDEEITE